MDTKERRQRVLLDDFAPELTLDAPINSHDSSLSTFSSHHARLCTLHMSACSCCLGPRDPLSLLGAYMHNRASDRSSLPKKFHSEWNSEEDVERQFSIPHEIVLMGREKRSANKLSIRL